METSKVDWNKRFYELSQHVASWSKDKSTGVGAIIVDSEQRVVSMGYNGFCTGCNDDVEERHNRPNKYFWSEHAERNAIYNAARLGVSVKGCKIYSTLFPCVDCTRAIIQSGIVELISKEPDFSHHKYGEEWKISLEMFAEVGINVIFLKNN